MSPERWFPLGGLISALICILLMPRCAHRETPPGGPVDRIPPQVADHNPISGATGVPLDAEITITFSETMDKSAVNDALFLSPLASEDASVRWKGRTMRIKPGQSLEVNTTYVITLGVGCKDLHNNRLTKSYSFAFSTGEDIDQGTIEGRVYRGIVPQMGVGLWAYRLDSSAQPSFGIDPPDYITQTDADGRFAFQHLGQGRYRLFAVNDLDDDREFDHEDELLGVPAADLSLTAERLSVQLCPFRLAELDTTGPSLVRIEAPHRGEVDLFFDQRLDSTVAVNPTLYRCFAGGDSATPLEIRAVSLPFPDQDRLALSTELQQEGTEYALCIDGLRDDAGNLILPDASGGNFAGSGQPDTTGPRLVSQWPEDSTRFAAPQTEITLSFSEAIQRVSAETSLAVVDSVGEPVSGLFRWAHAAELSFVPHDRLPYGGKYLLSLMGADVRDLAGNSMGDTLLTSVFFVMDEETPGTISGKILRQSYSDSAKVFIRATSLEGASRDNLLVTEAEEYFLSDLLPGRYRLSAFLDRDENARFSFGCPAPFLPAEPLWISQDTVRVRSRWETAGVDILFTP